MSSEIIKVPDIGGDTDVEIIEIAVSEGDVIEAEDTLITLESDKASMDVPAPKGGKVLKVLVKEGDSVSEGDDIVELEVEGGGDEKQESSSDSQAEEAPAKQDKPKESSQEQKPAAKKAAGGKQTVDITVPDLGGSDSVEIIEVAVSEGDEVEAEDTLITLESDKASMDVPSPHSGKIVSFTVKEGDTVSEGDVIGQIEIVGEGGDGEDASEKATPERGQSGKALSEKTPSKKTQPSEPAESPAGTPSPEAQMAAHKPRDGKLVHAGPAVRMLARELGVDLGLVKPSGPKDRVLKEDVQSYVKQAIANQGKAQPGAAAAATGGAGIPPIPEVDFSQFGEVEEKPMGRLLKMGATNLHRSWLNVPHVTQFDEADITELEAFRKAMKAEAEAQGAKLTPLPFMVKACAFALRKFPQFNVSLKGDGETLVWKNYVHIGIAVDTPDGLMVPVVRNADNKSLIEIAKEMAELGKKAQTKKLKRDEMTGGCFTISSLGSIGGTAFTPIVNAPEVAILGVSKAQMKPVWDGSAFQPRLMMPLSLSYDHRAINGADAARFTAFLADVLTDIRRLLL
ncbi:MULTISPECIES: dihydrolipoyllysine-residue acetyltransferase [Halomonadaceae]|uniref:dihydrolipoyllysine-residue acetyltransferase n=1 Tax=Halomonadaceae TaxID=28256 RepID=UPI0012F353A8|nr:MULTISPECIES: dihydrolipoyllysine-residue acetyltransferase [Halomonas]CAD5262174.1 Dihydrolipoyllysine-residue acetyltransferase component of pyruvate dehydrogenase complex [Halomonas sp. 113]CAD5263952.1 Dihydrolipoyllysine-residue acetyltransferase component of pyruvate dehydrogenase complex [Halomonas sp. 59]CAD5276816.1 Dihydrolipoyllysine-residue acetyltransferase component of pyruvate dehydrogenase complex [Halomonas sp. I3]CAD5286221.1 Dihydrolipoyllysine-residue acetyltransferase co